MTNTEPSFKILLCEGITDGFARASLACSILEKKGFNYKFAYTDSFTERNKVDEEILSSGLGLKTKGLEKLPADWEKFYTKLSINQTAEAQTAEDFQDKKPIIVDTRNSAKYWEHKARLLKSNEEEIYQDYSDEFKKILKTGNIIKLALQPAKTRKLFIHYRLGDIALLSIKDVENALGLKTNQKNMWISPLQPRAISFDEIINLASKKGINGTKIILDRFVPAQIYENFLINNAKNFDHIHLSSDGFARSAKAIKQHLKINEDLKEIENKLENYFLGKIKSFVHSTSIGETPATIKKTLTECGSASHWQIGGSSFPFDLFQKTGGARIRYSAPLAQRPNRIKRIFKGML